ncbi:MAG TPA: hypothetical protein VNT79_12335 [Phycisphaerae bacterium]|nr:hypothetical protein [Phycisphaerae bacterium]
MSESSSGQSVSALPPIVLKVDRSRALMRGAWRLAFAGVIVALFAGWDARWRLLWNTDRITLAAYLTFAGAALFVSAVLLISGLKWLALSFSRKALEIVLDARGLRMDLGPFGRREYDASRLHFGFDREIDADTLEFLPDDSFMPTVRHPLSPKDLAPIMQEFAAIESEKLTALLRPYLTAQQFPPHT